MPSSMQRVSLEWICIGIFTCCHTETEVSDQTCCLTWSEHTDNGLISPCIDSASADVNQSSHQHATVSVTGMTTAGGVFRRQTP